MAYTIKTKKTNKSIVKDATKVIFHILTKTK